MIFMIQTSPELLERTRTAYTDAITGDAVEAARYFMESPGSHHVQAIHQLANQYDRSSLVRIEELLITKDFGGFVDARLEVADAVLQEVLGVSIDDELPEGSYGINAPEAIHPETEQDIAGVLAMPLDAAGGAAWVSIVGYHLWEQEQNRQGVKKGHAKKDGKPLVFPVVHFVDGRAGVNHGLQSQRYFPYRGKEGYPKDEIASWVQMHNDMSIRTAAIVAGDLSTSVVVS